jgi:hypothetical protein
VADGLYLKAYPFENKIIDVDHPSDIAKAEAYVSGKADNGLKIATIMRTGVYSPNHIGNDTAILNAVSEELRKRGCEVATYTEGQLNNGEVGEDIIVNMCREQRSIYKLQTLENEGRLIINSGYGIENCTRERMTRLLVENDIPYPESVIVSTTDSEVKEKLEKAGFSACWVKRGEFHAIHKEDVSYARHPEEAQGILKEYSMRGIGRVVINRHLVGDLIKFYGVQDSDFFYWFYTFDEGYSKYGHEAINGKSRNFEFSVSELKDICRKAADVLGVKVYGGDCVVSPTGEIRVIDFNDWPSFAPCRNEAAPYIAECVLKEIGKHNISK